MATVRVSLSACLPVLFLYVRLFFFGGMMKANGVILNYVVEKLHTTNMLVGWAFTLQCAIAYMITPIGGYLLRFYNFRQLGVAGGILSGLGYVATGLLLTSVWQLFAFQSLSGIGFGLLSLPSYMYLQIHFENIFPTLISLTSFSIFAGVAVLPPFLAFLIENYGNQAALVLFGAVLWNCMLVGVSMKPTEKTINFRKSVAVTKDVPPSDLHVLDRYLFIFAPLLRHLKYAMCFLLSGVAMYVYSSWAIFLVSFGESAGFTPQRAVYLSSAGGIGGIAGSGLAFIQFFFQRMNVVTGCVIPISINGICLLMSVFSTDYVFIIIVMSVSGFVQGYHYSALCGMLTDLLCQFHLQDGIAITFLSEGIWYQLGGLISGIVKDYFESTTSVFLLNSIICFSVLPLALVWTQLDKKPVRVCYPTEKQQQKIQE